MDRRWREGTGHKHLNKEMLKLSSALLWTGRRESRTTEHVRKKVEREGRKFKTIVDYFWGKLVIADIFCFVRRY